MTHPRMKKPSFCGLVLALALTLSACGGGTPDDATERTESFQTAEPVIVVVPPTSRSNN